MKIRKLWLLAILLGACTSSQKSAVIFIPDPTQDRPPQEQTGRFEPWQIIESQNGPGEAELPTWVNSYLDKGIRGVESLGAYSGKYVFIGENRGDNLNVLQQWGNAFSPLQDLPRLIAQRAERRLITAATLYPDDEYGEFFERLIKKMSDGEYPGAVKEETFWLKEKVKLIINEEDIFDDELPVEDVFVERYEYLVLTSIDKEILQQQITEIMTNIKTKTPPTRGQTAAINKIQQTFFEEF